ncbi:MAG TPA: S8 family serine peptidase [Pyrinomonadaceae bacterium]|nr:S8 family serine peptidase [Pyrinomonadaceae bacterium]
MRRNNLRQTPTTRARRATTLGRRLSALCALALCAFLLNAARPNTFKAEASGVARSVIVEFKTDPGAVWKAKLEKAGRPVSDEQLQSYRASLAEQQNQFLAQLRARGVAFSVGGVDLKDFAGNVAGRADYRFNLVMNGITLAVPASAIPVIAAMPQVRRVVENNYLRIQLNNSVGYINAPAVYGQVAELTPFDNHREGFEGQGINIAVLDTGIDWTHAMFGGDPTPPRLGTMPPAAAANSNQKVIYYMSFSGGLVDDYGHGSAAASNAAGYLGMAPGADGLPGTADDVRVHGVAPQAKLMGYKVCTGTGDCVSASTILAIEDAVSPFSVTMQPKPVAHVINLSLGGAGGPDDATAVAASNAALLGTTVVASAGNAGPGEGTVGSPAAGRHVISVAATTHPGAANTNWSVDVLQASAVPANQTGGVTPARNLPRADGFNRLKLYPMAGTPDPAAASVAQRYVLVNNPTVTYPAAVGGRIALIKDAGLTSATFFDIAASSAAAGAVGCVLISTTTNPTAVKGTIPCSIISPEDGEVLVDAISSTDNNAVDPPNGAVSELPIRLNPYLDDVFYGTTTSFSSRGPVQGLGQIKPDVTAPGINILSATVRVGGATATVPPGTMFDPTGYTLATGTSFSGPHVSGVAALVKQAHLDWTPDMIRTAMINTATNMRSADGTPRPDGRQSDSILDQGGGLVDVRAAVNAKALMGVAGDGLSAPGILGSHSFGEEPFLNNRVVNTREVTVTIRDLSGQGGVYNLSTAGNRFFDTPGISASVSPSSVNVPAGGSATFTARVTLDGNQVRDTDIKQLQWYVVAERADGGQRLRMPMYLKATPSLPSDDISSSETETFTGQVLAGDAGAQRDNETYVAENATYVDIRFPVGPEVLKLDATLSWAYTDLGTVPVLDQRVGLPDLDFMLYDPNGNLIGSSGNGSGPEHIAANTTIPGEYVYRVYGWANGPTDFTVESTKLKGGAPPAVQAIASDFTLGSERFDFDGTYTLAWQPRGDVEAYEVEESTDGTNFAVVRTLPGTATSAAFTGVADGARSYRVRSVTPGRAGKFVTIPSNTESITVARRTPVDATGSIAPVNKAVLFGAGTTDVNATLKNNSQTVFYPTTRLEVVSVQSNDNSVRVANADNGGDGSNAPAVFDYSSLVGADFLPGEETATRALRFSNPNTVLFTFTARVTANLPAGGGGSSATNSTSSAGGTGDQSGGTSGGQTTNSTGGILRGTLLKFTVNPLTRTVSVAPLR